MKKTLAIILLISTLFSLCSCARSESMNANGNVTKSDFETPKPGTEATIDATENTQGTTIEIDPVDKVPSNTIGFTVPDFDFDIDIGGIEVKTDYDFDFKVPAVDFDFDIDPIEVKVNGFTFEFPDYQFNFDVETFDVDTFVEISSENFSEDTILKITEMEVEDVVLVAETRANLLADLSHAFQSSGLAVQVNEDTGEILLDTSVLFDVDKATISSEGKDLLKKFLIVYTSVVFNEKYDGFVSRVLIEGHTDSTGDYNYNLKLSQARADSVMAFCLSDESDVDEAYISDLENSLEAIGYSCDKLIYDKNGNEDKNASRRVSFRFLISLP